MHVHVYLKSFLARRRRLSLSAASSSCTLPKHTCITLLPQPPAAAASPSPALQAAPAPPPPLRAYAHAKTVGAPCRPRANPPLSPRRRPRSWLRRPRPRPRPVPPSPLLLLPGGGGLGRLRSLPLPPLRLLPRCKLLPLRLRLLLCALTLVQTSRVTGDWAGKARTKHSAQRRRPRTLHPLRAPARCARSPKTTSRR